MSHGERETALMGVGSIDGHEMVKGRLTLTRYNLRERDPALHTTDALIVASLRDLYTTLRKGSVGSKAMVRLNPVPTPSQTAPSRAEAKG
ncbi:MAG: hypothetical protein AB7I30_20790 [Isosphaeraceae bacterium]